MGFAEELLKNRKEHHWTQEELADKCNVSRQAVAKWERGDSLPDVYMVARLASLFHKSIEDLIFSADTAPAENKSFYIREIREEDRADFTELMCEHKFIGGLLRDLVEKAEVPADVDYARDLWDTYTRFQERFGIDGACYAICSKTSHEMTGFIRIAEPDSSGPNMNFQFKQKLTVHRDMVDLIKEFLNWFHRKYEARAISVDVNSDLERKIFMELGFKKVTDEVMVILPL